MLGKFKTALSHSSKLTLIMTGDDQTLTIAIFADPKKDGVKVQPITIKGNYDEVETALSDAITQVFEKNDALLTNAALVSKQVAEDAKVKATPAKPGATKKPEAGGKDMFKTETPEPEDKEEDDTNDDDDNADGAPFTPGNDVATPPKPKALKGPQKKAVDAAEVNYKKAVDTKDQDMINFLMKASVKLLTDGKLEETVIEGFRTRFQDLKVDSTEPVETVTAEQPKVEQSVEIIPETPVEEVKPQQEEIKQPPVPEPKVEDDDPDLF